MKLLSLLVLAMLGLSVRAPAIDLAGVPPDSAEGLRQAIEAMGGSVGGTPSVVMDNGPDGSQQPLLFFPDFVSWVIIPLEVSADSFSVEGAVLMSSMPFGESGGPVFGVMFGPANDYVLGLGTEKWSSLQSPFVQSGNAVLIPEEALAQAGVFSPGEWVPISLSVAGNRWSVKIGTTFASEDETHTDERNPFGRSSGLSLRIGGFVGFAILPAIGN